MLNMKPTSQQSTREKKRSRSKYKIMPDFVSEKIEKYCMYCGSKRKVVPNELFDPDTGKQLAYLKCRNTSCRDAQLDTKWEKQKHCNHEFPFLSGFINGFDKCKKCGYTDFSSLDWV